MTSVLVTAPFSSNLLDRLQAVSANIEIHPVELADNRWPDDKITDAEIIYAIGGVPRPEQAPNLRWLQTHWAGVNHLTEEPLWNTDIKITTASGIHAPSLAQYVLTQILVWANHVPSWLEFQRKSEWPTDRWQRFLPDELRGRTLGILGYGSIGRAVARLAKAFGLAVLATKRNLRSINDEGFTIPGTGDPAATMVDRIYPGEATRSMVAECDYIVISLPLTPSTKHLINEDLIRAMKPNCFLVNVGRGEIIVEKDLIKALKKGWIAGAGLDVFETEPLPAASPLWAMDNVIISPHVSGMTAYYDERATELFAENLRRYLADEPLLNLVNRDSGY